MGYVFINKWIISVLRWIKYYKDGDCEGCVLYCSGTFQVQLYCLQEKRERQLVRIFILG